MTVAEQRSIRWRAYSHLLNETSTWTRQWMKTQRSAALCLPTTFSTAGCLVVTIVCTPGLSPYSNAALSKTLILQLRNGRGRWQ